MMSDPPAENKPVVAMAVDDRMVYALLVLAGSIRRTITKQPRLVIGFFPQELHKKNQELIGQFLDYLEIEHELLSSEPHPLFSERRHLTITTFSKFLLADNISGPHLWLDLDTIVTSGWDQIFSVMHVSDDRTRLVVADMLDSKQTRFDGFNAGVLGWTATPREPWVDALASLPEKRFSSEQVLFNQLYGKSVKKVDVSYNFLSSWHRELAGAPRPRIIHYSGPVKPWHLSRRHRTAWQGVNSTWEFWFDAEASLLEELSETPLLKPIVSERRRALFSGRLHTGKGALAGWILRGLAIAGPMGDTFVEFLSKRSQS